MSTAVLIPQIAALTPVGESKPLSETRRVMSVAPIEVSVPTVIASIPTKKVNTRPRRIRLGVIHSPLLRLKKAIPVEISRKKDSVIATAPDLQEFGCGETMSDAIDDLSKGLAELFFSLDAEDGRLGDDLLALREKLSRYVGRRQTQ